MPRSHPLHKEIDLCVFLENVTVYTYQESRYSLIKLIDEISFPFPRTNGVQASHGF